MMNLKTALVPSLLALFLVSISISTVHALSEPVWIVGRVSSVPTEQRYNTIMYYEFNFTLADSNGTLTMGEAIPVIIETVMMQPSQGAFYNFTGRLVDLQVDDVPRGYFIVEEVNTQASIDIWSIIMLVVSLLSYITKSIAETLAAILFVAVGWQIPSWIISLVMVIISFYVLLKHWKAIGLLLIIVVAFVGASGIATLVRVLFNF